MKNKPKPSSFALPFLSRSPCSKCESMSLCSHYWEQLLAPCLLQFHYLNVNSDYYYFLLEHIFQIYIDYRRFCILGWLLKSESVYHKKNSKTISTRWHRTVIDFFSLYTSNILRCFVRWIEKTMLDSSSLFRFDLKQLLAKAV